jgi:hypothetical protein
MSEKLWTNEPTPLTDAADMYDYVTAVETSRDLERRLRQLGYSPAGPVSWDSAITSSPYADGIPESEVRELLNDR